LPDMDDKTRLELAVKIVDSLLTYRRCEALCAKIKGYPEMTCEECDLFRASLKRTIVEILETRAASL